MFKYLSLLITMFVSFSSLALITPKYHKAIGASAESFRELERTPASSSIPSRNINYVKQGIVCGEATINRTLVQLQQEGKSLIYASHTKSIYLGSNYDGLADSYGKDDMEIKVASRNRSNHTCIFIQLD